MIMTHGDDDGLRVPPRVAPKHLVILPVIPKPEMEQDVLTAASKLADQLKGLSYHGDPLVVHIDKRDIRGGEKTWQWIKRGIPLRVEIGPKDIEAGTVMLYRRDKDHKDRLAISPQDLATNVLAILDEMQQNYFEQARAFQTEHTTESIKDCEEFKAFFTPKNAARPEMHGGFVRAPWCGEESLTEPILTDLKVTIRCIPQQQPANLGKCVLTGKDAVVEAIFAKAY
jgi:prolyl-tRNA synthetase